MTAKKLLTYGLVAASLNIGLTGGASSNDAAKAQKGIGASFDVRSNTGSLNRQFTKAFDKTALDMTVAKDIETATSFPNLKVEFVNQSDTGYTAQIYKNTSSIVLSWDDQKAPGGTAQMSVDISTKLLEAELGLKNGEFTGFWRGYVHTIKNFKQLGGDDAIALVAMGPEGIVVCYMSKQNPDREHTILLMRKGKPQMNGEKETIGTYEGLWDFFPHALLADGTFVWPEGSTANCLLPDAHMVEFPLNPGDKMADKTHIAPTENGFSLQEGDKDIKELLVVELSQVKDVYRTVLPHKPVELSEGEKTRIDALEPLVGDRPVKTNLGIGQGGTSIVIQLIIGDKEKGDVKTVTVEHKLSPELLTTLFGTETFEGTEEITKIYAGKVAQLGNEKGTAFTISSRPSDKGKEGSLVVVEVSHDWSGTETPISLFKVSGSKLVKTPNRDVNDYKLVDLKFLTGISWSETPGKETSTHDAFFPADGRIIRRYIADSFVEEPRIGKGVYGVELKEGKVVSEINFDPQQPKKFEAKYVSTNY